MLPKAHLTVHPRLSGSIWVTTLLWLSGSLRPFYTVFCVCLPPLLSIFYLVTSLPFLSFIMPILVWNIYLLSLIFLKISLVFPILLFSYISLHGSLKKAFLSLLSIIWKFTLSWYISLSTLPFTSIFSAIYKASSGNHFAFLHFFFLGDGFGHCFSYVTNLCP